MEKEQYSQEKELNLAKLKRLIQTGVSSIPIDKKHKQAVLVLGDTGVGKTTILSYLARRKLVVRIVGLNTVIDSEHSSNQDGLKIGHDRFSETTVPNKVIIDNQVFFDCSGFKDNRGQQYQISNSFFVQRLFDLYKNIKILLIIDQISVIQARADKLPKLMRNLLKSFDSLKSIQDGVILLINRAKPEYTHQDYGKQILKLVSLKNDEYLFNQQQRNFLTYLVKNNKVCLFKQAQKQNKDKPFEFKEDNLFRLIKDTSYVKSKHIKNIISESAKLAIRHFMDHLASNSQGKTQKMCRQVIKQITSAQYNRFSANLQDSLILKQRFLQLIKSIKNSHGKQIFDRLNQRVSEQLLFSFEQDLTAVLFFKDIYDKSQAYFMTIKNVIIYELSLFVTELDKQIQVLQIKKQEALKLQQEIEQERRKYQKAQSQLTQSFKKKELLQNQVDKYRNIVQKYKKDLEKTEEKMKLDALQFTEQQRNLQEKRKREIDELVNNLKNLRIQIDEKDDQLQFMKIENQSLKQEISILQSKNNSVMNQSMISKGSSGGGKYPDVVCPHFKNGGKCKHCIKAWKESQNKEQFV